MTALRLAFCAAPAFGLGAIALRDLLSCWAPSPLLRKSWRLATAADPVEIMIIAYLSILHTALHLICAA